MIVSNRFRYCSRLEADLDRIATQWKLRHCQLSKLRKAERRCPIALAHSSEPSEAGGGIPGARRKEYDRNRENRGSDQAGIWWRGLARTVAEGIAGWGYGNTGEWKTPG